METVQTRHKSAQHTRQLRKMDRSMKRLTQLLKSPSQKHNPQPKSSPKKLDTESSPAKNSTDIGLSNKTKRNVTAEKIKLKPKNDMKVIGGINKRKLGVPHKGMTSPPFKKAKNLRRKISSSDHNLKKVHNIQSALHSDLSMEEIVRMIEDTQSLNDEDFMEILTCPSPVWWEDPPDKSFIEDAICTRPAPPPPILKQETFIEGDIEEQIKKSVVMKKHCLTNAKDTKAAIKPKDSKFVEKQSKLENVLGHLKKKIFVNSEVEIGNEPQFNNNARQQNTRRESIGDTLSDISINEEDMISHLENIDIPIENDEIRQENIKNDETNACLDSNKELGSPKSVESIKEKKISTVVPKNLPPLQRFPINYENTIESLKSMKSAISDDIAESNTSDIDSISDTNIRFLIDDEDVEPKESITNKTGCESLGERKTDIIESKTDSIESKTHRTLTEQKNTPSHSSKEFKDKMELITVYKIMTGNDELLDNKSKISSDNLPNKLVKDEEINMKSKSDNGLNLFFSECKKYRNRSRSCLNTNKDAEDDEQLILENNENRKEDREKWHSAIVLNKIKTCQTNNNGDPLIVDQLATNTCPREIKLEEIETEQTFNCSLCNVGANSKAKHTCQHNCKDSISKPWQHCGLLNKTN